MDQCKWCGADATSAPFISKSECLHCWEQRIYGADEKFQRYTGWIGLTLACAVLAWVLFGGQARADTLTYERAGTAQTLLNQHVAAPNAHPQYLWTYGSGAPSGGYDGQHYIRVDTGSVYVRTAGVWTLITGWEPAGAAAAVQADLDAHKADTSNPHSVTKAQVGLGNVDNTSDANKPVSTATQTALDLKAPLASPALTGTPTAPTAAVNTNTTQVATTAYVVGQGYVTAATAPVTSVAGRTGAVTLTSSDVGLGAVENTALSTWSGSTNLTTLGTVGTGVWNGSVIGSSYGGAGSVSGVLKANGSGVVTAAAAGTDYAAAPSGSGSSANFYRGDGSYAASLTGNFQVGADGTATGTRFSAAGTSSGGTTTYAFRDSETIGSGVTASYYGFNSTPSTAAASFSVPNLYHFNASNVSLGSGSSVPVQTGFNCGALTSGSTNNWCFHGASTSSGTGAFNLYMDGNAPNYLAGELRIGNTAAQNATIFSLANATGATTRNGLLLQEAVQSGVTSNYNGIQIAPSTQATSFTITNIAGIRIKDLSKGSGSTNTNLYGMYIEDLTQGGTLNAGVRCDVSVGTGKWCFYGAGTADYYLKGITRINSNSQSDTTTNLQVSGQAKAFNWGVVAVNKGAVTSTTTLDFTAGEFQTFTTTASTNLTVSFTAPTNPCRLQIRVTAPATNTPTITWPTIKGTALPTSVTATKKILLTLFYDGTDYISIANSAEY